MTSLLPSDGQNPWGDTFRALWRVSHKDDGTFKGSGLAAPTYVVSTVGGTITATPNYDTGFATYTGTDAYTVLQAVVGALTAGGVNGAGGGKVFIRRGTYSLTDELTLAGTEAGTFNPLSQIVFEGEGYSTVLQQNTSGKNAVVVKNGMNFGMRDLRITGGSSARSCLLMDSNGASTELSCRRSFLDNVHLEGSSSTYPGGYFKNFQDLVCPKLHITNNSGTALQIENDSTTTNYGNAVFGFLRCVASASSPYAGLKFTNTSSTAAAFMNLVTFENYECFAGYYGIWSESLKRSKFSFVDLENNTKPIYFDGTSGGKQTLYNYIDGYILAPGITAVTCTTFTGGNTFRLGMNTNSSTVPVSDASNFRPVNTYDLNVDNTTAIAAIAVTNPNTSRMIRKGDGSGTLFLPLGQQLETESPVDQGMLAWTYDPAAAQPNGIQLVAGTFYLAKIKVPVTISVTNVKYFISTVGATLTSGQCYVGLFQSNGTLIGTSADQSTLWAGSAGEQTTALASGPFSVTGGVGNFVWVAFVANGTTMPKYAATPAQATAKGLVNQGLTQATARAATATTGATALASFTPSGNSFLSTQIWAGLT